MKKNSEVRIQESECKTLNDSLTLRYQWGIQTRHFLVDHQIFLFCGGAKTPFIQTLRYRGLANAALSAFSFKIHSEFWLLTPEFCSITF